MAMKRSGDVNNNVANNLVYEEKSDLTHNICCHFCRAPKKTKPIIPRDLFTDCSSCAQTWCGNCVLHCYSADNIDEDGSYRDCPVCRDECCCSFEVCKTDHKHCYVSRRTAERHKNKEHKWTKKKKPGPTEKPQKVALPKEPPKKIQKIDDIAFRTRPNNVPFNEQMGFISNLSHEKRCFDLGSIRRNILKDINSQEENEKHEQERKFVESRPIIFSHKLDAENIPPINAAKREEFEGFEVVLAEVCFDCADPAFEEQN
jgi:hypothetical protein